jgi:hypothetical protein
MADTYVPGMEFQSWRSLPKITDALDSGSIKGFALGGLINALSGGKTEFPTNKEEFAARKQGVPVVPPTIGVQQTQPTIGVPPVVPSVPAIQQPSSVTQPSVLSDDEAFNKLNDNIFNRVNGVKNGY